MGVQFNVKIVPFSHPFIIMYYLFLFLRNSNGLIHFNMCEVLYVVWPLWPVLMTTLSE